MRAETVIATHGNTDFDAFAAMLAARRLYPGSVACLAGSLNRNVREFYRLHADELGLAEASRLELEAIRRLVVVETTHASRLGELEPVALDPAVEKVVFDHHAAEPPEWVGSEHTVVSEDGALTTTLVGVLAERELAVTPLEATAFALGIHEDTGSLTYPTATQRDAEALAWCLRHGARQELLAQFLHTPLTEPERELLAAIIEALERREVAGVEVLVAPLSWPRYVDGVSNLAHKVVDLTDTKALVLLVEMDERVFCVARSRTPEVDAAAIAQLLGGGGHAQAASAIFKGSLDEARRVLDEGLQRAARPGRADDPGRASRPDAHGRAREAPAAAARLRGGRRGLGAVRGRLSRRRHGPRHPARRAELRRRHRGRGRRDRPRAGARRHARRSRARARQVRHGGRDLRRERARGRRHRPHRVLRRPGRTPHRRARVDPPGPLPPRLHDQRHGGVAEGRRPRPAGRPVRRSA